MIIRFDEIDIPPEIVIFYAIPKDERDYYKVRSMNGGEYFLVIVKSKMEKVAFVYPMSDGRYDFTFFAHSSSLKLKRIMEMSRKPKTGDELRWVVLIAGDDNCWQRISTPEASKENALQWIGKQQNKKLMVIVSFVDNEVVGTLVKTRSANYVAYVDRRLEVDKRNMGAIGFQVPNWEG